MAVTCGCSWTASGFETVDVRSKLFFPKRWLGVGPAMNGMAGLLPFVHRLASTEILVARLRDPQPEPHAKTASIVLTTRDERENIEPMVRAIPAVGASTEILIVEGHSRDGTREEIERVAKAYPTKTFACWCRLRAAWATRFFRGSPQPPVT